MTTLKNQVVSFWYLKRTFIITKWISQFLASAASSPHVFPTEYEHEHEHDVSASVCPVRPQFHVTPQPTPVHVATTPTTESDDVTSQTGATTAAAAKPYCRNTILPQILSICLKKHAYI